MELAADGGVTGAGQGSLMGLYERRTVRRPACFRTRGRHVEHLMD